jgi:hypothetical protein
VHPNINWIYEWVKKGKKEGRNTVYNDFGKKER